MKISIKWLARYLDLKDKSAKDILEALTMSTAEVEGIETFAGGLEELLVGEVVSREGHPNADKLTLCSVDVGSGTELRIVCGAPNVAAGQKVVIVQPGQRLPDGSKIKKTKIRGVESFGMICSERELGLSDEHEGIIVLHPGLKPGLRYTKVVEVEDHVLEIENKSVNHRPDLWGHYGFARELAAIFDRPLAPWGERLSFDAGGRTLEIGIADLEACPRYLGLVLEGIQNGRSPDWLRYLLHAVGQRSIDLLVDLTNFVMLDLGQPMHAFDLRRLRGDIMVRRARKGETMETLDGVDRPLHESDLLITSGDRPVAMAGIMGGEDSMVAADTTEILLESANFHATTIRRSSARLGLRTDSSTRFEKALDPALAEDAVHRFVGLLMELCPSARPAGPLSDPSGWKFEPRQILLRRQRLDMKLGLAIESARVRQILAGLQFGVEEVENGFLVDIPSFRAAKDISIEDDLIEEVGRMFRYDNIPEQPLKTVAALPRREEELYLARQMLQIAALELGCTEVYNYSFVSDSLLEAAQAKDQEYARIQNPVAPDLACMRRRVMPSLLGSLVQNLRLRQHQHQELRLVELGKGYLPETRNQDDLPHEVHELAMVLFRPQGDGYPLLRSLVSSLLSRVGYVGAMEELHGRSDLPWIHPSKTVAIMRGDLVVGHLGLLHPQVSRNLELGQATAICTLDLRQLLKSGQDERRFVAIPRYPSQPVDVALMVQRDARVADLRRFLQDAGKKLVRSVSLFEVYRGEGLPEGMKSLNFTVTLGASDRTLTQKDEEKYLGRVREGAKELGAELRG